MSRRGENSGQIWWKRVPSRVAEISTMPQILGWAVSIAGVRSCILIFKKQDLTPRTASSDVFGPGS